MLFKVGELILFILLYHCHCQKPLEKYPRFANVRPYALRSVGFDKTRNELDYVL